MISIILSDVSLANLWRTMRPHEAISGLPQWGISIQREGQNCYPVHFESIKHVFCSEVY